MMSVSFQVEDNEDRQKGGDHGGMGSSFFGGTKLRAKRSGFSNTLPKAWGEVSLGEEVGVRILACLDKLAWAERRLEFAKAKASRFPWRKAAEEHEQRQLEMKRAAAAGEDVARTTATSMHSSS